VAEDAGGFGSGSVYGEGNGATGDFLTGEGSGSDIGEGGGYANEGGGGYVDENGQTSYVYTIGSYFPDRPVSFFPSFLETTQDCIVHLDLSIICLPTCR
jgi:hypothetical protein